MNETNEKDEMNKQSTENAAAQAWLQPVLDNAKKANPPRPDDYMVDGVTYCGTCRKPKTCFVPILGDYAPCECDCAKAKLEQAEKAKEEAERAARIQRNRDECFGSAFVDKLSQHTFENDNGSNPILAKVAKMYTDEFDNQGKRGKGLLIFSDTGNGKSYFGAAIANRLLDRGLRVRFATYNELNEQCSREKTTVFGIADLVLRYDLLIWDEFTLPANGVMNQQVLNGIDALYKSEKPFIVLTNLKLNALEAPRDPAFKPIAERILARCPPVWGQTNALKTARQLERLETLREGREILDPDSAKG